jgi:hypothetical protein
MKKLLLLSLVILFTTVSFAQFKSSSQSQSNVSFGVKAGFSYSGIRGDAANSLDNLLEFSNGMISTKMVTGFFAGGFVTIPVTQGLSLDPGVYYSEKGYEMVGQLNVKGTGFLGANAKATLKSSYIDMPVLLKADLGGGLQLFAGPQFSYLSKANLHSSAGLLGIDLLNNDMDVTSRFNRWDAGVTGGLGYTFGKGINISASYDYGLSKVDANKSTNAYNHAFKVGVGISL